MTQLVLLLAAAALVSLQGSTAYAQIDRSKLELDNRLIPNEVPAPAPAPSHRRRTIGKYIKISIPPPETVRYVPGTSIVLKCEAMGNPAPMIDWLKNGVPITDFEEDTNEIMPMNQLSPAFLISKHVVSAASNGDVFTCLGTSGVHEVSASTTVYVEGDGSESLLSQIIPSAPIITATYTDLFLIVGSPATFPCRVFSPSTSQVTWMDNKNKVVYGNSRMRVLPSGDLHITTVGWNDLGLWTCSVKNAYGRDVAETFFYPISQRSRANKE